MNLKEIKKIFFILVIIGIILKIFNITNYLLKLNAVTTISTKTALLITSGFIVSIDIIALGISLYFAWKNKIAAYGVIGTLVAYSLYKAFSSMFKQEISFQMRMIPSLVLWITIIILAFVLYYKLKNYKEKKSTTEK